MKTAFNFLKLIPYKQTFSSSLIIQFLFTLSLSWLYAIMAQMIIPIYPVVITILPLPIYLLVYFLGASAAYAFILYLFQGILGAPFFAHGRSGIEVLVGPSGGYLMGMVVAAIILVMSLNWYKNNWRRVCLMFIVSEVIVLGFGLAQLSFFVAPGVLLVTGLYPFVLGEVLKVMIATVFVAYHDKK